MRLQYTKAWRMRVLPLFQVKFTRCRSLFKKISAYSQCISRECRSACTRQVPLPRSRTATRVSNLPTHRVSARDASACERANASSALNEFSSSPRAKRVRRPHTCARGVYACLRACLATFSTQTRRAHKRIR